ncbi:MAG: hypothetical protein ABI193_11865 [Minicystis sp.]
MCMETKQLAVAVIEDSDTPDPNADVVTVDGKPPILRVDDKRLDSSEKGMQRRRKLLAVLYQQFPMALEYNQVTAKKIEAPYEQGPYKNNMWWARALPGQGQQNSCAPVNSHVMMESAKASGTWGFAVEGPAGDASTNWKTPPSKIQKGFVKYRPGILPSVGDVFILYHNASAEHCGVICQASLNPEDFWLTCDGGQPDRTGESHLRKEGYWSRSYNKPDSNFLPDATADLAAGEAAYLVPRKLDCSDPHDPRLANFYVGGGGVTLYGWRNLSDDSVFMKNEEFDSTGIEEDYQNMKKRILRVDELAKWETKWRTMYHPTEI